MTTANSSSVGDVTLIFKLNNRLVKSALEGLTDDEVWTRPHDAGNAIGWILGHITETRGSVLAELGDAAGMPWPKQFSRGSSPATSSERPSRALIEEAWSASSGRMRQVFERLTPERLAELPKRQGLPGVTDIASFLTFMAFHESYHVGQLGYVRRLLGKKTIAD